MALRALLIHCISLSTVLCGSATAINLDSSAILSSAAAITLPSTAVANNAINAASSAITSWNASDVHQLLFRAAYSSAAKGIRTTLSICDAVDWCTNAASDWCPDAVNATLTTIPSKLIAAYDVDYNDIRNVTLLSLMSEIGSQSARTALSWAQTLIDHSSVQCSSESIQNLRKAQWCLTLEEGSINYDPDRFDQEVAVAAANSSDTAFPDNSTSVDKDDDDDTNELAVGLPFLATAFLPASICAANSYFCDRIPLVRNILRAGRKVLGYDELLYHLNQPVRTMGRYQILKWRGHLPPRPSEFYDPYWTTHRFSYPPKPVSGSSRYGSKHWYRRDLQRRMKQNRLEEKIRTDKNLKDHKPQDVLDTILEEEEPGEPPIPVAEPAVPVPGFAPPPMFPPAPAGEAVTTYMRSVFNPATGQVAGHQTLRLAMSEQEVTDVLSKSTGRLTQSLPKAAEWLSSFKWLKFDVLDSIGNVMEKDIWCETKDLVELPGKWVQNGEQFLRIAEDGFPVVDGLGAPVVASAAGTLMGVAPSVVDAGEGVVDTGTDVLKHAGSFLFSLFLPEGGQPRKSLLSYNAHSGEVKIGDPKQDLYPDDGTSENNDQAKDSSKDQSEGTSTTSKTLLSNPFHLAKTSSALITHSDSGETATTSSTEEYASDTSSVVDQVSKTATTGATPVNTKPPIVSSRTQTEVQSSFTTVTSSPAVTKISLSTRPAISATSPVVTIYNGCYDIASCSKCEVGVPPCMIAELPDGCAQDGNGLAAFEELYQGHRKSCDQVLLNLTRQERKMWAVSITPQNCLPIDEWDPTGYDRLLGEDDEECSEVTQNLSTEEIEAWTSGLLPLKCPWGEWTKAGDFYESLDDDFDHSTAANCWSVYEKMTRHFAKDERWSTTGLCGKNGCRRGIPDDHGVVVMAPDLANSMSGISQELATTSASGW